jgi:GlpG protein
MRQAGTIPNQQDAQRFVDYLKTLGVNARAEEGASGSAVWVIDEDQIARGRQELSEFLAEPNAERYAKVAAAAAALRQEEAARAEQAKRNMIDMRRHWEAPAPRQIPLTLVLMLASIAVTVFTNFGHSEDSRLQEALKISATPDDQADPHTRGLEEIVEHHQLWRLVTPIFLHYTFFHLFGNMYWLYVLGGLIESRGGTLRFALLVLVAAVISNLAQYFNDELLMVAGLRATGSGGPNFGGFSGVVFATFGYVWVKSKYDPGSGMFMASGTAIIFLIWLFLCMTGAVGDIANSAHTVGLIVGMLLGLIPAKKRRRT